MGGSGGGHKSGGGGSGKQSWPKYMHRSHWAMLIGATQTGSKPDEGIWSTRLSDYETEPDYSSVIRDIAETHDNSPFEGHFAFDPATRLQNMTTEWDTYDIMIDALDDDSDVNRIIDNAKAKVDALVDEETIQGIVDKFDQEQTNSTMTSIARFSAGMADIGGHNSSAYVIGLALLEDQHLKSVRKFDKDVRFETYKDKLRLYDSFIRIESQLFNAQNDHRYRASSMKLEIERMGLVAEKEQLDRDVELSIRDSQWELEVWQYGSNVLAGISGAIGSPTHGIGKEMDGGSKLSGALGGAMSGAAMGTMVAPGIGTAIGGVLGAGAGLMSS